MKRFLLSLFVVPLLLIGGFSSAQLSSEFSQNIKFIDGNFSLSSFNSPVSFSDLEIVINSPSNPYCIISFKGPNCTCRFQFYGYSANLQSCPSACLPGSYSVSTTTSSGCPGLDFTVKKSVEIVPVSSLTPVITGISDVTTEFIPYVVYIGIGTLFVTLGFIAVKWLVNWLVRKITVIFKSKRG